MIASLKDCNRKCKTIRSRIRDLLTRQKLAMNSGERVIVVDSDWQKQISRAVSSVLPKLATNGELGDFNLDPRPEPDTLQAELDWIDGELAQATREDVRDTLQAARNFVAEKLMIVEMRGRETVPASYLREQIARFVRHWHSAFGIGELPELLGKVEGVKFVNPKMRIRGLGGRLDVA